MSKLSELKSNPATLVAQTRVDSRHLAALGLYWHSQQEHARSVSELIRLSLEEFSKLLISNQMAEFPETQEHALEILSRLGITGAKVQPANLTRSMLQESGINLGTLTRKRNPSAPTLRAPRVPGGVSSVESTDMMAELERRMALDHEERCTSNSTDAEAALAALGQLKPTLEGE